jgi:hypothetical protein
MDDFDLNAFLPDNNPKPDPEPEQEMSISTDIAAYDIQAVNDLATSILDSALRGLEQEDINELYIALQDMADYQTINAVQASTIGLEGVTLSPAMYIYLYLIDSDLSPVVACKALKISKSQAVVWTKENKLFAAVMSAIKAGQAEELESVVWYNARYNPAAEKERMFALKARKPEYRDNAPPPSPGRIDVRITIDNADIDISDNYRKAIDITPEDEESQND